MDFSNGFVGRELLEPAHVMHAGQSSQHAADSSDAFLSSLEGGQQAPLKEGEVDLGVRRGAAALQTMADLSGAFRQPPSSRFEQRWEVADANENLLSSSLFLDVACFDVRRRNTLRRTCATKSGVHVRVRVDVKRPTPWCRQQRTTDAHGMRLYFWRVQTII